MRQAGQEAHNDPSPRQGRQPVAHELATAPGCSHHQGQASDNAQNDYSGRRQSGRLTVAPPPNQAARRAVIKSSSYRWQTQRRPTRQAARPYVYASLVLDVNDLICRRPAMRVAESVPLCGT
jgi:hypothetical protein